ncbi:MAG: hypothetical protein A2Z78_00130 [Candidatus Nealsonbacteria bacterium RBG_13_36_15]|uniref:Uncharacterized protein n=1 Tax=Candidatus Nealsonbacteria bacterium RBG_13_36_15 TaxID=1801660 RepID=A0A1G2DVV7_9BACT|nr:MAG: hypothetical protein A2Z78_00130 [Candidatus Nealsonbacteria bacterium RBG_13_36_15]
MWKEINILQAELYFSRVQTEQLKEKPDPNMILGSLIKARNIMPDNDSYRRALSATALNFAILAEQQKTLTDESKQQLLQTAVVEGEMAVRLAPHNIFNWENLQRVYSTVTLENQDDLLMNNVFLQEISLDPTNPGHRNDLGLAYINLRNDTELAKINFQNAISLKPDFVDAHYSLAIIYRQEGKKEKAVQAYDQTLSFLTSQISFLEPVVSSRADLQSNLDQLKQLEAQIESERGALLLEIEEEQQPEISPEEAEIKKTEEETTPIETGE